MTYFWRKVFLIHQHIRVELCVSQKLSNMATELFRTKQLDFWKFAFAIALPNYLLLIIHYFWVAETFTFMINTIMIFCYLIAYLYRFYPVSQFIFDWLNESFIIFKKWSTGWLFCITVPLHHKLSSLVFIFLSAEIHMTL